MTEVLRLERFSYRYPGASAAALHDVSLSIAEDEFVVVAGATGSGKSTLLRAASGLVPHFHGGDAAGHVVVGGLDTRDHGPAELSAVAGTLFQDPETQVVLGTVRAGRLRLRDAARLLDVGRLRRRREQHAGLHPRSRRALRPRTGRRQRR